MDSILKNTNCNILYVIKYGQNDNQVSKIIKTVVHCVFNCTQPHGDVYVSISPIVKNNKNYPIVPHMINLPDVNTNIRNLLNIPDQAVVFGRYGGMDQFDIKYVHNIIRDVANNNKNIYFIFANTAKFTLDLPNVIYLGPIVDSDIKTAFINTCDAMIWARSDGETFGLSIAEFSSRNKPVIATKVGKDLAHVYYLKDQAIWYDENNLESILTNFNKEENAKKDWNAFRDYTPEKVMKIFKKVFI